jgi:ferric-dicitrate binding protein FerR (iron transport regulator)
MNEGSLPPFATVALRSLPGAVGRALGRLFARLRRRRGDAAPEGTTLHSRAASVIRAYSEDHATLFERAERLREKVDRLEKDGTPSESARNRAERARREVEAGLAALRASFAASVGGREGWRAFDREVERRYPAFRLSDGST